MLIRLLVLADGPQLTERIIGLVDELDVDATEAPTKGNFWDRVAEEPADLILLSHTLLGNPTDETIASIRALPEGPDVVVLWKAEIPVERARLLTAGCSAVLQEDLPDEALRDVLEALSERRRHISDDRLRREFVEPEYRLSDFDSVNPMMRSFMRMVRRMVEPDSSLLILGETGVGKERLARAIHLAGPRRREPFIPINCAAFPESLLEGELFGYEEGAFTGATADRRGYFESAHGGTIFLDEIGELPKHLQVKLLRVLQERTIQPLGSEKEIEIDVRVMAATNRDLEDEIKQKRFRRDLFYRLGVVTLEIPPLREHPEDIPALLQRYLENFRSRMGRAVYRIAPDALEALCQYDWPGNIRELINVIERAVILCEGDLITLRELPSGVGDGQKLHPLPNFYGEAADESVLLEQSWHELRQQTLDSLELRYLTALLVECRGHLNEAAIRSGIKPRTLYQMMKRHGLDKREFKSAVQLT